MAASFNLALADVLCNSEALHYKPRMISVAEREGFANTINKVCSTTVERSVQEQFESTVFSRTRTKDTIGEDECKANFQSIIEACIVGKNAVSGSLVTNGLTVEIHLISSNNEFRRFGIADKKKVTRPKGNKTPKLGNKNGPKKSKDKTPEKASAGETCSLKPGKGKGKGKNNNGKKTPTRVIRDLIAKLVGRAGSEGKKSSDYGSDCDDKQMTAGGAWGEDTYRGYRFDTSNTMDAAILLNIAKSAYQEVKAKRVGDKFVVAALFVPGQGVFLGTVPHGLGVTKVQSFAPANAPELWTIIKDRTSKTSTLYHAEDMAMLHAYENHALLANSKFPAGSKMATWGKVLNMPKDERMPACSGGSSINPTCKETLKKMEVKEV